MSESFNRTGEAYRIFAEELRRQRENVQECLSPKGGLRACARNGWAASFHRIKGAAGFFGLEDLRRVSGGLEKLLSDDSSPDEKFEEMFQLLEDFVRLSSELPPAD